MEVDGEGRYFLKTVELAFDQRLLNRHTTNTMGSVA